MAVLQGSAELSAALRALPTVVSQKVLRKSAIAGARVVRDQVQVLAPVAPKPYRRRGALTLPGTLKRAVVLKFAPEKSGPDAQAYVVTVRRGKSQQKSGRDAFYWVWVEQGHRIVAKGRKRVVGQVPAHPFFVPAYRATAATARAKMKSTMEAEMTTIIKAQTFARITARAAEL